MGRRAVERPGAPGAALVEDEQVAVGEPGPRRSAKPGERQHGLARAAGERDDRGLRGFCAAGTRSRLRVTVPSTVRERSSGTASAPHWNPAGEAAARPVDGLRGGRGDERQGRCGRKGREKS